MEEKITIADLIPFGIENAISNKRLIEKCVASGLIDENIRDKDRTKRNLLEEARCNHTIINLSNGAGYYRPTKNDVDSLKKYISQERHRAINVFKNIIVAKKIYADFQAGRIK